jgi:hypothetical protein
MLPGDSPEKRLRDVQHWTREYQEWRAWFVRWHNRHEPGWISTRARRQRPVPPEWLPGACADLLEDDGPLADGCRAWREWRRDDYAAVLLQQQVVQSREELESPRKSVWWEHFHLDGLWPMTQSGSSAFGVFGFHLALNVTERVQVFLAPGAIVMRVPSGDGSHTWTTATDWGFSFKLFDFSLPVTRRPSTLHFNLARVWLLGGRRELPLSRDLYLAGFSVSFRQPNAR